MAQAKVLITGANGTLGQDLISRLSLFDALSVMPADRSVLDLSQPVDTLCRLLDQHQPQVIINAGAFTGVDLAESERDEAMKVNARAPEALAKWCQHNDGYLLHISTDYVFDGQKGEAYTPADTPKPINAYGYSKLVGEEAVLSEAPDQSAVLRTSWLFGKNGKNFVPFVIRQLQAQAPLRIVKDQWGTPTWSGNLCKMLQRLIETRQTGLFHGTGLGGCTRLEQAQEIAAMLGLSPDPIEAITTDSLGLPAKRPPNTTMVSSFDVALDWPTAFTRYWEAEQA
jgi:dTDP-4-dehydrorhamnose reductase